MTDPRVRPAFIGEPRGLAACRRLCVISFATATGSATALLAAAIVALTWANIDFASYERVWHTQLFVQVVVRASLRTYATGSTVD